MTAGAVKGNDVLIFVGGVAIACLTGCTFQSDNSDVTVTCKDDDGAENTLGGSNAWSITGNGIFKFDAAYGAIDLLNAHKDDDTIVVKFGNAVVGDSYITGNARIPSFTWDGPLNDAATFAITMKGKGSYSIAVN